MNWFKKGFNVQKEILKAEAERDAVQAERDTLKKEVQKLKEEQMTSEFKKKMDIEEIKHLNRLAQEKRDVELEREKIKYQREYNDKVEKLEKSNRDALMAKMEEYHRGTTNDLREFNKDMKDTTLSIYKDIIARLPNVNVKMNMKEVSNG